MGKNVIPSRCSRFKDEWGRTLTLRGVNLGSGAKAPAAPSGASCHRDVSFVGRPFPIEEADEHLSRLKSWGMNFIRLLVTWEAVEHAGPGVHDQAYLDYIRILAEKAVHHGFRLYIDPHQDVWSRFSGGDGAPGWTFDAIGMDIGRFAETGAALVQDAGGGPYPPMIWPTNAAKLAAATMFTLFFGGRDFAPRTLIEGEPAQEYLQRHYLGAIQKVAGRLRGLAGVMGYGVMNEPQAGYIGWRDLTAAGGTLKLGECPAPFQAMLLGAGVPQNVEVWERWLMGYRRAGLRRMNPEGVRAWREGYDCIWRQNGVWDLAGDGAPRLLRPDHFSVVDGRMVDFTQDCLRPFALRFARAIRSVDPDAKIFLENDEPHPPPPWKADDPEGLVYAPHWYDGPVMYQKRYFGFMGYDRRGNRIILGRKAVRTSYADQLLRFKRESAERLRGAPVILGEFGIPFDLDGGRAYGTGDWRAQIKAMDRSFRAMEDALMDCALWNYSADNTNREGDGWNGEDFSLFSRDQRTGPEDAYSGGRALEAAIRPYARAAAGEPLAMSFDIRTRIFTYGFRHDPGVSAPTEFFVPDYHYPDGYSVEVTDGTYTMDRARQTLVYLHGAQRREHGVRVRPCGREKIFEKAFPPT